MLRVQARLELARVHLALADLAGARTLMRAIEDLLWRRPGLGTPVGRFLHPIGAMKSATAGSGLVP
jgi:hypothetical protein